MKLAEYFELNRPNDFMGKGDSWLLKFAEKLHHELINYNQSLNGSVIFMDDNELSELAVSVTEFAEDVYLKLGFWESYEDYNFQSFGKPYPLEEASELAGLQEPFYWLRIKYLLLYLFELIRPRLFLSPFHMDVKNLSIFISDFLQKEMKDYNGESSVKQLMDSADIEAGDVKTKLIWLGSKSYLFRLAFKNRFHGSRDSKSISSIDDYLCQHSSKLSGMGINDVLAYSLNIDETRKNEIKSWNEKHVAFYKILSADTDRLELLNVINNQSYHVYSGKFTNQFPLGRIIFGALIPWNNNWYWSGEQKLYENLPDEDLEELKEKFLIKAPQIYYRYSKEELVNAKDILKIHYQEFVDYFNDDLVVFKDGLELATAMQKKDQAIYHSRMSEEELAEFMKKHELDKPNPHYNYPQELIDSEDGIGVFFNPEEGLEYALNFSSIISGFKKKARSLSEDEWDAIQNFVLSYSLSHHFVRKVARTYGAESLLAAFCINNHDPRIDLEFILRKYKGHFFRERYPNMYIMD